MTERHLPVAPAALRAGEVAARAHVNVQTLRYYERRGLLPEPRRLPSGYRAYPAEAVRMVRFIKQAQALGFTLEEIRSLQRLTGDRPGNCGKAQDIAAARISELTRKSRTCGRCATRCRCSPVSAASRTRRRPARSPAPWRTAASDRDTWRR